MHASFLDLLMDPLTHEPLELVVQRQENGIVIEGSLVSRSNRYPIVRGIPRFAGFQESNAYTDSFGYQWNKWSRVQFESENRGKPMEGHTRNMWQRITSITGDLASSVVAEFGCGPGRFLEVCRMKGARVIGLDFSSAVEAAQRNFANDPDVLICQADVLNSPIKPASLDGAFSIGVFHHTPSPKNAFEQMGRAVKPGGWAAVCVYGKGGYYDFPTVSLYRNVFKFLTPVFRHYPALAYSYFTAYLLRPFVRIPILGKLIKAIFPFVPLPDARWALLDTFDSVTPTYQSAHESYEVFKWLKDCGFCGIEPGDWGFTSWHGRKPENDTPMPRLVETSKVGSQELLETR